MTIGGRIQLGPDDKGRTTALWDVGAVPVYLDPDECLISAADVRAGRWWVCSRPDHPTPTSDCTLIPDDDDPLGG